MTSLRRPLAMSAGAGIDSSGRRRDGPGPAGTPAAPRTPGPDASASPDGPAGPLPTPGRLRPRYDQRGHHDLRHHKRKKSWLEDIFD